MESWFTGYHRYVTGCFSGLSSTSNVDIAGFESDIRNAIMMEQKVELEFRVAAAIGRIQNLMSASGNYSGDSIQEVSSAGSGAELSLVRALRQHFDSTAHHDGTSMSCDSRSTLSVGLEAPLLPPSSDSPRWRPARDDPKFDEKAWEDDVASRAHIAATLDKLDSPPRNLDEPLDFSFQVPKIPDEAGESSSMSTRQLMNTLHVSREEYKARLRAEKDFFRRVAAVADVATSTRSLSAAASSASSTRSREYGSVTEYAMRIVAGEFDSDAARPASRTASDFDDVDPCDGDLYPCEDEMFGNPAALTDATILDATFATPATPADASPDA